MAMVIGRFPQGSQGKWPKEERMAMAAPLSWPQPSLLEKVRAGASGQPSYTFLEEMGWRRYDAALATQAVDIGFHAKSYEATSRW